MDFCFYQRRRREPSDWASSPELTSHQVTDNSAHLDERSKHHYLISNSRLDLHSPNIVSENNTASCFVYTTVIYLDNPPASVPAGSPSRGGDVTVYVWRNPTELAHSFLFCSCVRFCLYGPFNCISFRRFSRQLSVFSLCFCGLSSALLVLSTKYLFMKVSHSPDILVCGWLGLKHQLTN